MGPFKKGKTSSYATQNGAVSSLIFFKHQFDTATLIIQSLGMIKARGCKQMVKSDLLYVITWYLVGLSFTCSTIIR